MQCISSDNIAPSSDSSLAATEPSDRKFILFVDDDVNILYGLRRMLRNMRNVWDMEFVEDVSIALKILDDMKVDVVVSDMKMPYVDGSEFFQIVKNKHPKTARIVLSGQSDRDMVMRTVEGAHQYLSKPCDSNHLKDAISRTCALRKALTNEELLNKVSGLSVLPTSLNAYNKLKKCLCDESMTNEATVNVVVNVIARDPGMTAKVLQLVNSDFFCYGQKVSNINEAVRLLGVEVIRNLVLSIDIFSCNDLFLPNTNLSAEFTESLWRHSLCTAVLAQQISYVELSNKENKEFVDDAFAVGLLHDIGISVLCMNDENYIDSCIKRSIVEGLPLWQIERSVLSITHAEIGAYLLGLWGLPDTIIEGVLYHHHPERCLSKKISPTAIVHVANCFDHLQANGSWLSQFNCQHACTPSKGYTDSKYPLLDLNYEYLEQIGCLNKLLDWKLLCSITDSAGLIDRLVIPY